MPFELESPPDSSATGDAWPELDTFLDGLARPIVVVQPSQFEIAAASSRQTMVLDACRELLDATDGSLIVLDTSGTASRLAHCRVRHAAIDFGGRLGASKVQCLKQRADLLVAFDPGPNWFEAIGSIPALSVWCDLSPCQSPPPGPSTVNLVTGASRSFWACRRSEWNLVEYTGNLPTGQEIARIACHLLSAKERLYGQLALAREVQLRQLLSWCRRRTPLSAFADRHQTFDCLLRETTRRFADPLMIETGCIRQAEDWSAGYSTYLFAAYLDGRAAGSLHSVDLNPQHLRFAAEIIKPFERRATFHESDSVAWLKSFTPPIDVLYLDSLDAQIPGHAEHALAEIAAGASNLHEQSLILFDDTVWNNGWAGKGAKAVPWLMDNGWRILKAGYQVLLGR